MLILNKNPAGIFGLELCVPRCRKLLLRSDDNVQFGHLTQDIALPCTTLYVLMINNTNNVQFHHISVWTLNLRPYFKLEEVSKLA